MTWNDVSSSLFPLIGTLIGGGVTYFVQNKLCRNREIRFHKANLIQTQIIIIRMINEIKVLERDYKRQLDNPIRHLSQPIFITSSDWTLNKVTILNNFYYATKDEYTVIENLSDLDKDYKGLIGAIGDKIQYYNDYKIGDVLCNNIELSESKNQHLKELTDHIYKRIEIVISNSDHSFKTVKNYIDKHYPGISISYEISG